MVDFVAHRGLDGAGVLEIGGGLAGIVVLRRAVCPTGTSFRTFAHPPQAMRDVLLARGINSAYTHRDGCGR